MYHHVQQASRIPSPSASQLVPQRLIPPLRDDESLLLRQHAILIDPDLLRPEPNLDAEFLDVGREDRSRAIRPLLQHHVLVGAVPEDGIPLAMRDRDLPELAEREELEADLGRTVGLRRGLRDCVDEGDGLEQRQPEALEADVAVVRRVDATHRAVVVCGTICRLVPV